MPACAALPKGHDAPDQENQSFRRCGDGECVDDCWNKYDHPDLKNGTEEKDDRPHACPRKSYDKKTCSSESGLDECDAQDPEGDAVNRGADKPLVLRNLLTQQTNGQRTGDIGGWFSFCQKNSGEQDG